MFSVTGGYLNKTNSVRDIRATRGVNFFYTGMSATSSPGADNSANLVCPVFKGHGKVLKVVRYSSLGVANMSALVHQLANVMKDDYGQNPFPYIDIDSFIAGTGYSAIFPNKNFNGVDLLFNLLFNRFGYPDHLSTYGFGSQHFFSNSVLTPVVAEMYHGDAGLTASAVSINSYALQGQVQDIAYLVEGFQ